MKIKDLLALVFILPMFFSCGNQADDANDADDADDAALSNAVVAEPSNEWQSRYDKIETRDLPDNVIQLIGEGWMLVTAGKKESFNTMTASWGGIAYIWERPSTLMFIRDSRYTYQFLQAEESFTLSFFSEQYRGALRICGTKSGRDTDKIKEAGLTAIETPSLLMSFDEARMIIECKKTLVQELDYANLTDAYKETIMEESYNKEPTKHQLFISEIINIWIKK
ncbi:hypothetical protein AwDysgo_15650 [Bacteroidales bacterium]|nr:hypothetical protein AwDysgo_15650 [Bacteroidales bacterium]